MINNKLPLKEIAKLLGVSPSTISIVLHNRPGVSDATREKVSLFLKKNGYQEKAHNAESRDIHFLKYSASGYLSGWNDGFTTAVIDAIGLESRTLGYNVKITSCHEGEFQKVLEMVTENPMDGMILLGTDLPLVYEDYFRDYPSPVVLIDTHMAACGLDSVVTDNGQCIQMALDYLYGIGHRHIGFIYNCYSTFNFLERRDAFYASARRRNLSVDSACIFAVDPQRDRVNENVVAIMRQSGPMPSALIAGSETIAAGMIRSLKNEGYRVPEDISIVGIGDSVFCRMTEPPLTTVQIPADYMGHTAVRLLHQRIITPSIPISRVNIFGELVCRKSATPYIPDKNALLSY